MSCLCCGGKIEKDKKELCSYCERKFKVYKNRTPNVDFNYWLSRQLVLKAGRLARYGFSSRCSAVTRQHRKIYGEEVGQCFAEAIKEIDGHRLCSGHFKSYQHGKRDFVSDIDYNFEDLKTLIKDTFKKNEQFRIAVLDALEEEGIINQTENMK